MLVYYAERPPYNVQTRATPVGSDDSVAIIAKEFGKGRTDWAKPVGCRLEHKAAIYFRDQFRDARARALHDAEAYQEVLFSIERFGSALTKTVGNLGTYRDCIIAAAKVSPLAEDIDWSLCDQRLRKVFLEIAPSTSLITDKDRNGLSVSAWQEDERSSNFIYTEGDKDRREAGAQEP